MNTLKNRKSGISNRKRALKIFLAFLALLLLSCAPGSNDLVNSPGSAEKTAGFFKGLWHGFIALFTFITSLFNNKVNIYEVHNSGTLYNLGFIIGVSAFFGGSGQAGKRTCRKKEEVE